MTFIVGVRCVNGLVLAADSLEGDNVTRRLVNKLEIYTRPEWGLCWGVAGPARVADKFSDKLKLSLDDVDSYNGERIENIIETCLKMVGKRYAHTNGIEVIVGCFGPRVKTGTLEWHLFKGDSQEACLSKQRNYCCSGTGDNSLANFVLTNFDVRFCRTFQAQHVTIFVTSLMKEYADRVGGPTRVWTFTNPTAQWLPLVAHRVRAIENEFAVEGFEQALVGFWQDTEGQYFNQWMEEENKEDIERRKQ